MDKLRKCSRRPPNPTPAEGLKFDIQQNPMAPLKSIVWQRRAAADSGTQADDTAPEDVPYVLLYMTVNIEAFMLVFQLRSCYKLQQTEQQRMCEVALSADHVHLQQANELMLPIAASAFMVQNCVKFAAIKARSSSKQPALHGGIADLGSVARSVSPVQADC